TRVATRHRLIIGASEMSGHLKQIAGEDAGMWLKLEVFGHERGEPTGAHGTSVLTSHTQGIDESDADHSVPHKTGFDLSDEDDDDSDVDDLLRARNRPPSLPTGELTSVIAVRKKQGGDSEMLTKVRSPDGR